MLEGAYKTGLTKRINDMFLGRCFVVRLDANLKPGIPDMLLLFEGGFWVALEAKTSANAKRQPNQPYYVSKLDDMSMAAFIYPENEEAVLNEIAKEFETHWAARLS